MKKLNSVLCVICNVCLIYIVYVCYEWFYIGGGSKLKIVGGGGGLD